MPSLSDLGQFKFSFNSIAIEKDADGQPKPLPYEDLPLPTTEAVPMEFPKADSDGGDVSEPGGFDFGAFLDSLPVTDVPPPPLDDIPEHEFDSTEISEDEIHAQDAFAEELSVPETSASQTENFDTFDMPVQQTDEIDIASPEAGSMDMPESMDIPEPMDMSAADEPQAENSDFNMDELLSGMNLDAAAEPDPDEPSTDDLLGDFNMSGGEVNEEPEEHQGIDLGGETLDFSESVSPPQPSGDTDEFSLGDSLTSSMPEESTASDDFDLSGSLEGGFGGDLSDGSAGEAEAGIDLGGEDILQGGSSFDLGSGISDFDSDGLGTSPDQGDFDAVGSETPGADEGTLDESSFDTGSFDLGGEQTEPSFDDSHDAQGAPPIDLGDLGADFSSDSIDLGNEFASEDGMEISGGSDFSSSDFGSSDFSLEGIDDLFEKTKTAPVAPPPKKSFWKKKKTSEADLPEAESDIEEIQLSEHDVEKLMQTIASYPLNLRIACEELIAEQVILPQQLSRLIRCLINNVNVRETAALVEEITGKPVIIPKSFEKMTGAAFEAEQSSFAYIFIHNFLPVFRLFLIIAALVASVAYLGYRFVYIPITAENLYRRGYEQIAEDEYQRANELFQEAFKLHQKKKWFYLYAEAFRDKRMFNLAEEKYDQLLRYQIRDKKGVLDYANLNTYYLLNYEKANRLLQEMLLDYAPRDYEGLLAAGDNFLLWAASDPENNYSRFDDARYCYARLLELYGWEVVLVERMLKYFIHTDNLKEVLNLRSWFESDTKRKLSAESLAELAGYLLDKQMEEVKGVPDPYLESILSVRGMLLQAIDENPNLPEPHYHLARYHNNLNNPYEERLALENAIRGFDLAAKDQNQTETVQRRLYRIDAHFRYSNVLLRSREFFTADEEIIKAINLYKDFHERRLIPPTEKNLRTFGMLYAAKGDIEYFTKPDGIEFALDQYRLAEDLFKGETGNGYVPPEILYRMGAAHYQLVETAEPDERNGHYRNALEYMFRASAELPLNRRMLYALGNAAYQRNDYFAAQGYYSRLINILETQRDTLPVLLPNRNVIFLELGERMMLAYNNMGVVCEALADQTGNRELRTTAMAYYAKSIDAWDSITRDPETMTRSLLVVTPGAPSVNLAYLNFNNTLRSSTEYTPQIFPRIDKDVLEPSYWEELTGPRDLRQEASLEEE